MNFQVICNMVRVQSDRVNFCGRGSLTRMVEPLFSFLWRNETNRRGRSTRDETNEASHTCIFLKPQAAPHAPVSPQLRLRIGQQAEERSGGKKDPSRR